MSTSSFFRAESPPPRCPSPELVITPLPSPPSFNNNRKRVSSTRTVSKSSLSPPTHRPTLSTRSCEGLRSRAVELQSCSSPSSMSSSPSAWTDTSSTSSHSSYRSLPVASRRALIGQPIMKRGDSERRAPPVSPRYSPPPSPAYYNTPPPPVPPIPAYARTASDRTPALRSATAPELDLRSEKDRGVEAEKAKESKPARKASRMSLGARSGEVGMTCLKFFTLRNSARDTSTPCAA
ncbi:hypothetical protein PLICRDRAFT_48034 [Plicaturopsis crispa FD-325 SS-3]|nr:hypothetical protein PLICRDRAFT_48034 [Plicaturopsis crispa FD-325 SS-3]